MNYFVNKEYIVNNEKKLKKNTSIIGNNIEKLINDLYLSLLKGDIQLSLNITCELFCSNQHKLLYNSLIIFYYKNINYKNISGIKYLLNEYKLYINIYTNISKNHLHNFQILRNHLTNIIIYLCESDKYSLVLDNEDIDVENINHSKTISDKINTLIYNIIPYISNKSVLYDKLFLFLYCNYIGEYDVCFNIIKWFIYEKETHIEPYKDFKLNKTVAKNAVWVLWKYFKMQIYNIKTHDKYLIPIYQNLYDQFLLNIKYKNTECNIYILCYILIIVKNYNSINYDISVDFNKSVYIIHNLCNNILYINIIKNSENKNANKLKDNKNLKQSKFINMLNDITDIDNNYIENQQVDRKSEDKRSSSENTNQSVEDEEIKEVFIENNIKNNKANKANKNIKINVELV